MWRTVSPELFLSGLVPGDREHLVEALTDGEIARQAASIPNPYTLAHADEFIAFAEEDARRVGIDVIWGLRESSGRLIGCIGLHDVRPLLDAPTDEHREGSLGYWLAKPYRGRGLMTQAVEKVCEVGFYELELDEIVALVKKGNHDSEGVLVRAGFALEAELPGYYERDGKPLDGRRYRRGP